VVAVGPPGVPGHGERAGAARRGGAARRAAVGERSAAQRCGRSSPSTTARASTARAPGRRPTSSPCARWFPSGPSGS
jgi:hypothetical protein